MLDTDTLSFALRGVGNVAARLLQQRPSEVCMSAVSLAELRFGAEKRRSRKLYRLIETLARSVTVEPFDERAAVEFGKVADTLARRGKPIGEFDTLIASHAAAIGATFVTNNTKHFARVAGLTVENWV